jgi:hypothetical protein
VHSHKRLVGVGSWSSASTPLQPGRARNCDKTALDLEMAVGAQEHAFVELKLERTPTAEVVPCQAEALGARIDVMKLQRGKTPRVSAEMACTALVLDHAGFEPRTIFLRLRPATRVAAHFRMAASVVVQVTPTARFAHAARSCCRIVPMPLAAHIERPFDGTDGR